MQERQPPQDLEAESSVLGAMMTDEACAEIASEVLKPEHFSDRFFRTIFAHLQRSVQTTGHADYFINRSQLEAAGIKGSKLWEILQGQFVLGRIEAYCQLLLVAYRKRLAFTLANEIHQKLDLGCSDGDLASMVSEASEGLSGADASNDPQELHELATGIANEALSLPALRTLGLSTGVGDGEVDDLMHGLRAPRYIVMAARTGVGKTTFVTALAIGCRTANPDAGSPLILSTEMTPGEIATDGLASQAGIHRLNLLKRNMGVEQRQRVQQAIALGKLKGVYTKFVCGSSLPAVKAIALRHKRRYGLPLLVVDLAPQLSAPGENAREKCKTISSFLAALKVELDTCIIACVQINRSAVTESKNHRPSLHHIKDAGNWEEDADQILMLHRPGYFGDSADTRTEVIQWKDRATSNVKSVWIDWQAKTGRYVSANANTDAAD